MKRLVILSVLISFLTPLGVFAEGDAVSRRDGFLMLWETIKRPAEEARETPFIDVPVGANGFLEIRYAKARGILGGEGTFSPDESLRLLPALLWLLRTRNVDDLENLEPEHYPKLAKDFAVDRILDLSRGTAETQEGGQKILSREDLQALTLAVDTKLKTQVREVSLYSEKFHGKGTAFGESFDMHALTAAHRTFPSNTLVRVTNAENGKTVIVRVNDRGPFVAGRDMDLSLAAFTSIAERSKGVIDVTLERLGDFRLVAPPGPVCPGGKAAERKLARLQKIGRAPEGC